MLQQNMNSAEIMTLEKMGSRYPSRLSFSRSMLRRILFDNWKISKSKFDLDDQKSQKNLVNEIHFNVNQNVEISENDTNNFDLFNNENQSTTNSHQVDLTEIEQEDKDIDEKVLEIPAFLRRQAN